MNERHLTALRLRTEGATFKAIGGALGVGPQRARTIFSEAERMKREAERRKQREEAIDVLHRWAASVRCWRAFREEVKAIDLLFGRRRPGNGNQAKASSSGADLAAPMPRGSLPNSLGTSNSTSGS